ncbi:MAG: TRAM domain-containing protein, partial [Bryobacteraceae bacterium]|nr:TRAM domain-containing protein [Bryobacteraceae bacterium]
MEVRIEKLLYGGDGLARTEGKVVMAPFVAPGELVEVQILKEHPSRLEAKLAR